MDETILSDVDLGVFTTLPLGPSHPTPCICWKHVFDFKRDTVSIHLTWLPSWLYLDPSVNRDTMTTRIRIGIVGNPNWEIPWEFGIFNLFFYLIDHQNSGLMSSFSLHLHRKLINWSQKAQEFIWNQVQELTEQAVWGNHTTISVYICF